MVISYSSMKNVVVVAVSTGLPPDLKLEVWMSKGPVCLAFVVAEMVSGHANPMAAGQGETV
jgi:hypothetical protein